MSDDEKSKPWYAWFIPNWPKTWPGAAAFVTLLFFVGFLLYWLSHDPAGQNFIFMAARYAKSGKVEEPLERLFVFTTPSALTKYDLIKGETPIASTVDGVKISAEQYYVDDPPNDVDQCGHMQILQRCFGRQIETLIAQLDEWRKTKVIQGYEFYESVGAGTHGLKRGLTWKVTVPMDSIFSRVQIIDVYSTVFHRKEDFYIEEFRVPRTMCHSPLSIFCTAKAASAIPSG